MAADSIGTKAKMAEDLAYRMETLIMERGWPTGQLLGSETELIEQFEVSRAVFREAVRILEHHGVARMRRGPKGGLIASEPDLRAVQWPATLFLDFANVSAEDLFTVRSTLELTCIDIVVRNLDEAGVLRLREALDGELEEGEHAAHTRAPHDLHVLIAELTGNPALQLFVEMLVRFTHERTSGRSYEPQELAELHRAHGAIIEALIAGDGALAQRRMRIHLAATATHFYARNGNSPTAA
ncbi:FadR/GntR family transcriptional regulator [Arthrobacter sp. W4I7]|uniref:FadR/GntR family transcriptional regulator n=1 Tax=Arthrobacter sp. W4I7 TaxID=3042296 RepID=UPI0027D89CA7|nr:FCD domain-containing protein [Arthrobacter sp. W4I7]